MESGYATAECASAFTEAGFEFTVMTPESYVVFKNAMAAHSEEVRKEAHYIASHDCYGLGIEGVECLGGTYDAHLFFDASRAKEEIDSIHQKAQALHDLANERVHHADKFRDKFAPHVVVTRAPKDPETGKTYHAELDHEVIQAEIDSAGYFLVVSSPGHASEEVLGTQRLRDRAERELERHDSFFGMHASGTRGTRAYVGKTFMGFLALVTCESFRWLTRDAMGGSDTCATLLDELRKLQCFRDSDGKGSLATGMTKRQKEIFACLGMSEGDVEGAVAELSL